MHKHPKITEERIRQTLKRIRLLVHRTTAPLEIEAGRSAASLFPMPTPWVGRSHLSR